MEAKETSDKSVGEQLSMNIDKLMTYLEKLGIGKEDADADLLVIRRLKQHRLRLMRDHPTDKAIERVTALVGAHDIDDPDDTEDYGNDDDSDDSDNEDD